MIASGMTLVISNHISTKSTHIFMGPTLKPLFLIAAAVGSTDPLVIPLIKNKQNYKLIICNCDNIILLIIKLMVEATCSPETPVCYLQYTVS